MSLKRHCDACNGVMAKPSQKRRDCCVTVRGGTKHLARITVDTLTATGAEDVCWDCILLAIRGMQNPMDIDEGEEG